MEIPATLSGKMDAIVPGESFDGIVHTPSSNQTSKRFHAPFDNTEQVFMERFSRYDTSNYLKMALKDEPQKKPILDILWG